MTYTTRAVVALGAAAVLAAPLAARAQQTTPAAAASQPRALSLDEALRVATTQSEAVRIAQAGVTRARGQQMQARSAFFPQLNGTLSYTRTLASQFEALQGSGAPTPTPGTPPAPPRDTTQRFFTPCTRYLAPAGAGASAQIAGLETFARCTSDGGGGGVDFSKAGFGARNQYNFGLSGSWTLFSAGRNAAQSRAASAGRRSADIELTAQRAQLQLDVTQAYFDAALADRLVAIAESSLVQTESALKQTQLARQVGNTSEFEQLRAQVTRDNQLPVLLQSRTNRDIAYIRLRQLLNLPSTESLILTDGIGDEAQPNARTVASTEASASIIARADTAAETRAPVRQLIENVRAQQAQLTAARAEWFPNLSIQSQYGKLQFPVSTLPNSGAFLTNWTVGLVASVPIFNGGRIRGENLVAAANLEQAKAQLDQTRELAALDAQLAVAELRQAEAQMSASSGTATQANRAYNIAEVRYREGISTQLELSESRVQLQQALANRAQAARDLRVAQVKLSLIRDLPLGSSTGVPSLQQRGGGAMPGSGIPAGAGGAGATPQQQTVPQGTRSASAGISPGTGQ